MSPWHSWPHRRMLGLSILRRSWTDARATRRLLDEANDYLQTTAGELEHMAPRPTWGRRRGCSAADRDKEASDS